MNFDLDDPLDGLLSDGSNDSLFGNEPAKKPAKSAPAAKPETKHSKMEDLFGIKSDAPPAKPATVTIEKETHPSLEMASRPATSGQPSSLGSFQSRKTSTPVKKVEPEKKKEITFDDSDVLSDLGFDPKKPKSKSNILDDILGGPIITSSKEITSKQNKGGKQTLGIGKEEPAGSKTVSRQSTETSENLATESTIMGGYAPSGNPAGPRRSGRRKSSTAMHDPLGLFGNQFDQRRDSKAVKKGSDWLGLNDDSSGNDPPPVVVPRVEPEIVKPVEAPKPLTPVMEQPIIVPAQPPQIITTPQPTSIPFQTIIKPDIATSAQTMELLNNETQGALNTLQQQEFQLMVASQMKNQEQALLEMQHKQQSILQRQEAQFNELLQKQIQRHNQLEQVISRQQERINSNIQVMMTQPVTIPPLLQQESNNLNNPKESRDEAVEDPFNKIELQSDVKRLELEKLRLEDLVSNVTANHEQEITLLEQSYKKQMAFLDDSLKIMEARLKLENKNLEDFYKTKLDGLEDEKQQLISDHAKQIKEMEDGHRAAIEKLKASHEESLADLKQEHREMINNIRESKLLEFSVLQDNQSYMTMLKSASNYLENASGDLQQLRDTLQEQIEFTQKEKEQQLKRKEKELEDQQRLLERSKESTEQEKLRLLNLVETLEGKLTELTRTSSEDHWTYQQKLVKLESEKQSFEKEKDYNRERAVREEKRIEELKQLLLEEHTKLMQKVHDERQAILEEKAKLETLAKIQKKDQSELSRAEINASIKVAEDASRQAEVERERLLQLQRQFEAKKRELFDQESQVRAKASELETAIGTAKLKEHNAENAFKSIKRAEQNLQLKMQLVQRQFREVSDREDRLSKDKIGLSKERLELQSLRKRLQTTRCSLCKISERSQEIGDFLTAAHNNSESVADDRKLEANFFEMQQSSRDIGKLDNFFDGDVERQLQSFLERNRVESGGGLGEAGTSYNMVPNIAENEDGTIDTDLLLLKFDVLKTQDFFGGKEE
ncbi:trichohyalin [Culex pipiens pallens]|uniref:trichohyalin n=1 Tax=Culex pipiens pallens TaxID=42434 RepID=UPI001952F0EF|nr:trichohyalin [Culex pipiens pallens]